MCTNEMFKVFINKLFRTRCVYTLYGLKPREETRSPVPQRPRVRLKHVTIRPECAHRIHAKHDRFVCVAEIGSVSQRVCIPCICYKQKHARDDGLSRKSECNRKIISPTWFYGTCSTSNVECWQFFFKFRTRSINFAGKKRFYKRKSVSDHRDESVFRSRI